MSGYVEQATWLLHSDALPDGLTQNQQSGTVEVAASDGDFFGLPLPADNQDADGFGTPTYGDFLAQYSGNGHNHQPLTVWTVETPENAAVVYRVNVNTWAYLSFYVDGQLWNQHPATGDWDGGNVINLTAGTHTFAWTLEEQSAGHGDSYSALLTAVRLLVPDTGGGSSGYQRGDWLKHLGGVYICRVDGATTEPGPGDTDEWFEVVARPVAAYTPNPADLPVRAAVENPFAPGEAGLWLQLDGDGNVIGQLYEDGEA